MSDRLAARRIFVPKLQGRANYHAWAEKIQYHLDKEGCWAYISDTRQALENPGHNEPADAHELSKIDGHLNFETSEKQRDALEGARRKVKRYQEYLNKETTAVADLRDRITNIINN